MRLLSRKDQPRRPRAEGRRSALTTYYRSEPMSAADSPFSKKTPKRNGRKYLFGLLDIVLVLLILGGIGYTLAISSPPKIIVNNTSFHTAGQYQAAATAQLERFSNRNKITFNEQSLASALQKQFPEVSDVQVELPVLSQRPTIRLTVAAANFVLNSQASYYTINADGKAVERLAGLPAGSKLPVVQDQSGFRTTLGAQVLSADAVSFIDTVIAECRHAGVPIASLTLPSVPQELDLRASDQAYFVKFYLGGDALTETGQFLASRQHFKQTGQPPSQYLDVRVAGKVFYK